MNKAVSIEKAMCALLDGLATDGGHHKQESICKALIALCGNKNKAEKYISNEYAMSLKDLREEYGDFCEW